MAGASVRLAFVDSHWLAPGVRHLRFRPVDGSIAFQAGQFMQLSLTHFGESLRRSYSIASIEGVDDTIDFAVSDVLDGRATEVLGGLKPGAIVEALGPLGRMLLQDEAPCRHVFVATGSGVTPFRAMLRRLQERLQAGWPRVELFVGARRREDLLYVDDFRALAAREPKFSYTACISREPVQAGGWLRAGRVLEALTGAAIDPAADVVYACGNPAMVDEVVAHLRTLHVADSRIRTERYIAGA